MLGVTVGGGWHRILGSDTMLASCLPGSTVGSSAISQIFLTTQREETIVVRFSLFLSRVWEGIMEAEWDGGGLRAAASYIAVRGIEFITKTLNRLCIQRQKKYTRQVHNVLSIPFSFIDWSCRHTEVTRWMLMQWFLMSVRSFWKGQTEDFHTSA